MTRAEQRDLIAAILGISFFAAVSFYALSKQPQVPTIRFLWIGNLDEWNGACLDLETRQIVPSIYCEE